MIGKFTNGGSGLVELPNGVLLGPGESAVIMVSDDLYYLLKHPGMPLPAMDKYALEQYQIGLGFKALGEEGAVQFERLDTGMYTRFFDPMDLKAGDNIPVLAPIALQIASVVFEVTTPPSAPEAQLILAYGETPIVEIDIAGPTPPPPPPPGPEPLVRAPEPPPTVYSVLVRVPGLIVPMGSSFNVILAERGETPTVKGTATIGYVSADM